MAAKAEIDVIVNGADKLKELEKDTEKLQTRSVALGNIYAKLAEVGVQAFHALWEAGSKWLDKTEELNGSVVKTKDLHDELSNSLGMAAGSIMEATGAWDAYRETLISLGNVLDAIAGKEAIYAKARMEHLAMEKEYQEMLKENAKWKEAEHKKEMARLEKEYEANIKHQKLLSEIEEKVRKEKEAYNKTIEQHLELTFEEANRMELLALGYSEYGDQLKDVNAAKEEAKRIAEEYGITLEEEAQAVQQSTAAHTENAQAVSSSSSAKSSATSSGGTSYSSGTSAVVDNIRSEQEYLRYLQSQGYNTTEQLRQLNQQMADLYREARETNNLIRE